LGKKHLVARIETVSVEELRRVLGLESIRMRMETSFESDTVLALPFFVTGLLRQLFVVVVLPDGRLVEPTVAKRL
jgi:hypothetical protein